MIPAVDPGISQSVSTVEQTALFARQEGHTLLSALSHPDYHAPAPAQLLSNLEPTTLHSARDTRAVITSPLTQVHRYCAVERGALHGCPGATARNSRNSRNMNILATELTLDSCM